MFIEEHETAKRPRLSTIYDADFALRVKARAKIIAGLLPDTGVEFDLDQSCCTGPEPCGVCDRSISADEPRIQMASSGLKSPLHELCYLAWYAEVLEG